ncbi:MAG: type II toxin-antitoxin system prevent-host-death family antitoxin [Anaerolineales bacterium]
MSNRVGAYEAKTHFSALLQRVRNGERIYITYHDLPIAVLSPVEAESTRPVMDVIAALKNFRREHRQPTDGEVFSIKALIEEGRL